MGGINNYLAQQVSNSKWYNPASWGNTQWQVPTAFNKGFTGFDTNTGLFTMDDTLSKHLSLAQYTNLNPTQQLAVQNYLNNSGEEFIMKASQQQLNDIVAQAKNGTLSTLGNNGSNSFFGWGKDRYGNTTLGGGTALNWAGFGLGALTTGYGIYQGNKQLKLAQQNFEEQKRLNHANYMMNAKSYNNSLRNQQSGRGYVGMSGSAMKTLGREYDSRKSREDY